MSDDSPVSKTPADADAAAPVRPRRTVPARARKSAAAAKKFVEPVAEPAPEPVTPQVAESSPAPETEDVAIQPAAVGEWPEMEPAPAAPDAPKRKRRRRKGKGGAVGSAPAAGAAEQTHPLVTDQAPPEVLPGQQPQRQKEEPRPAPSAPPRQRKADPELLAKRAWKIYLSEVSEEGVALIGDNDAKELSRRCFRLAEIFLEEQSRRIQ